MCGPVRTTSTMCGPVRTSSTMCGPLRTSSTMCGPVRTTTTMCGPVWTSTTMCEPLRTTSTMCGPVRGSTTPLFAIKHRLHGRGDEFVWSPAFAFYSSCIIILTCTSALTLYAHYLGAQHGLNSTMEQQLLVLWLDVNSLGCLGSLHMSNFIANICEPFLNLMNGQLYADYNH